MAAYYGYNCLIFFSIPAEGMEQSRRDGYSAMPTIDFAAARHNMVESQIRTNKVRDLRLLDALDEVPREAFVPPARRAIAYNDEDLPVGGGRYLLEPMVLARMIQAAEVEPSSLALDVACATGYSSALLGHMGATVVGVDPDKSLLDIGSEALTPLTLDSVVLIKGEIAAGYPKQAPYNVILISGAVAEVPKNLTDQLADGGRLVAVIRSDANKPGRAVLFRRAGDVVSQRTLFDANTPILPGFEEKVGFVF